MRQSKGLFRINPNKNKITSNWTQYYTSWYFQKNADWTMAIDSNANFTNLIDAYYRLPKVELPSAQQLFSIAKAYHGQTIIENKRVKEEKR